MFPSRCQMTASVLRSHPASRHHALKEEPVVEFLTRMDY